MLSSPAGRARLCAPLAIALVGMLAGCASTTQFTNLWRDPAWSQPPIKKMFVVALRKDPIRRRMWEDGLVGALGRHGVEAVPSYRLFPDAAPDTQQVIEQVRGEGYDGVLVSMRLPTKIQETYVPGITRTEPVTRQNPFTGAYYTHFREIQEPGHVETDEVRRFQTDLWDTREGGRLVWSGTGETLESVDSDVVKQIASEHIVSEVAREGLVPPKVGK